MTDRVVSLFPAATELCCVLGVDPVGVSHACDYPPRVADCPTLTSPRVDVSGTSREIDEQVQAVTAGEVGGNSASPATAKSADQDASGGVFALDRDRLAALDPDLILTQSTCDVCAVEEATVRATLAERGLSADVVTIDPHSLSDVFAALDHLGGVLGREERATAVVENLRARVAVVEREAPADGPTVTVLDWLDPVMVAGHWVPELVERAGGSYLLSATGDRSRPREWRAIRDADPEVLVAAPCGFDLDQTLADVGTLAEREGWSDLAAVRAGQVYAIDGDQYMNRPGPRLVDALELLAAVLAPDRALPDDAPVGRLRM